MPHGVVPPAQLPMVPRTVVPLGSAEVVSRSSPAAGPVTLNGVCAVTRRLWVVRAGATRSQEPGVRPRLMVTTAMPCEAIAIRLIVASSYSPSGNMSTSSVYSWLVTRSARSLPVSITPT